jgi:hypothetical protein
MGEVKCITCGTDLDKKVYCDNPKIEENKILLKDGEYIVKVINNITTVIKVR